MPSCSCLVRINMPLIICAVEIGLKVTGRRAARTIPSTPTHTPANLSPHMKLLQFGKSKQGAHKRGLKPNFSEQIRGNPYWKIGLFRADWGFSRVCRGPFQGRIGPIHPHLRNCSEKALFPIVFRAKPPFAKPLFGFSRYKINSLKINIS